MSFVSIIPEILSTAADNLQSVGLRLQAQNTAAVIPTTGLVPPASDEVSTLTAMQFAAHARRTFLPTQSKHLSYNWQRRCC